MPAIQSASAPRQNPLWRWRTALLLGVVAAVFAGAWVLRMVDDPAPTSGDGETRANGGEPPWERFENDANDHLAALDRYVDRLTSAEGSDPASASALAEEAGDLTDREIDRLREFDHAGGVPACYADAAAAYGRAVFAYDISFSYLLRYSNGEGDDLFDLANDFLADGSDERADWERLGEVADSTC